MNSKAENEHENDKENEKEVTNDFNLEEQKLE